MRQQNTLDAFIKKPARPPRPKMKRMYTSAGEVYRTQQTRACMLVMWHAGAEHHHSDQLQLKGGGSCPGLGLIPCVFLQMNLMRTCWCD
jgi:hypothetical protein